MKSQSRPFAAKITDAAYKTMCQRIRADGTPNLLAMYYDRSNWQVNSLILIPRFAFSEAAIEKRRPARVQGRTKLWVGCNILLGRIPVEARLLVIENGKPVDPRRSEEPMLRVRKPWPRLIPGSAGHWTCWPQFAPSESNRSLWQRRIHWKGKWPSSIPPTGHVRQDSPATQVLRDAGLLDFVGRGAYRMRL